MKKYLDGIHERPKHRKVLPYVVLAISFAVALAFPWNIERRYLPNFARWPRGNRVKPIRPALAWRFANWPSKPMGAGSAWRAMWVKGVRSGSNCREFELPRKG